ncbi:unnamed protein product [Diabrotica balteata]|uniref:Uncharacterized protein n=1 Tax=Diabrotica balteata TaxID=107213 RepID=A0A9N9X3Q1_DIABA|nr:unnamed protein product [Diabrotica balteata]
MLKCCACFLFVSTIATSIFCQEFRLSSYNENQQLSVLQKHAFADRIEQGSITVKNCSVEKIEPEAFYNVNVKKIVITDNTFTYLRRRMFSHVMVDELYLDHNKIDSIEPGTFNYVLPVYDDALQILSLTHNKLEVVTRGMFSGTNFRKVLLNYNEIDSIEFGSFEHMPYLLALGLNGNKLQSLGTGIFTNLKNPLFLALAENNMHFLHMRAFENSTIMSLDLQKNNLGKITRESFVHTQIGWLYV